MALPRETIRGYINDINEDGEGLNDWELSFMEDISDQFDHGRNLTEAQVEKIVNIRETRVR